MLSYDDKKEKTDHDEGDEMDINDTIAFSIVLDIKDTSLHVTNDDIDITSQSIVVKKTECCLKNFKRNIISCTPRGLILLKSPKL